MKLKWIPKHLEKYLVIAIATIILSLDILNITSTSVIYEATLAVLAVLMFFLIKLENKIDNLHFDSAHFKISKFYQSRETLPSLEETASIAKNEIIIWGACLGHGIVKLRLLRNKLEQNCKIKILLMSLTDNSENNNMLINKVPQVTKNTGFEERLKIAHKELKEFYSSLDEKSKSLFEVRAYDSFPTATYLFIDKDLKNGMIRTETNLFGFYADELPSFEVLNSSNSTLYQVLIRSFQEIWGKANSIF
ncbi:MAG: hypothetical protein GF353_00950 [Candidatus Lokiarchaeota archaeon]|nr:hypothetical protein [Candidatus Lokiarchaeota archaeon]